MTYISFTRADLDQALQDATAAAHTTRQQERVTNASAYCAKWGGAGWVLTSPTITIKSASSDEVYTLTLGTDFMEHQCRSRKPCWHQTLGSIIMAANQLREDREALEYGVWYADQECCGGQGCERCMVMVEPAFTAIYHAEVLRNMIVSRPQLAPAIITHEYAYEVQPW